MVESEALESKSGDRRALLLLAAGALAGMGLATAGILRSSSDTLPTDAIARVNHRVIRAESFERAWRNAASDRRNPMLEADRAHVLKRMIEEELLIQRGEAIGLVESDSAVRKSIATSMLQSIVAESEAEQPDEAELRDFYRENQRYFAGAGTLRVRQVLFTPRSGETHEAVRDRARVAREAIGDGLSLEDAGERYGDAPLLAIPDTRLPVRTLQRYIGPTLVDRASAMQVGEVSEPIESAEGVRILQLIDATSPEPPEFEAIRDRIEAAFQRDAADRALRDRLDRLWDEADIALAPEAPTGI